MVNCKGCQNEVPEVECCDLCGKYYCEECISTNDLLDSGWKCCISCADKALDLIQGNMGIFN